MIPDAYSACSKRGLQVMSEEAGYYFVKNSHGLIYPVKDTTVAEWIKADTTNDGRYTHE